MRPAMTWSSPRYRFPLDNTESKQMPRTEARAELAVNTTLQRLVDIATEPLAYAFVVLVSQSR